MNTSFDHTWFFPKDASFSLRIIHNNSRGTITPNSPMVSDARGVPFVIKRETLPIQTSDFQEMLRSKWPTVLAEAKELAKLYPDPIQGMISLLGELPRDYQTWREIIEEPYG